MWRGTSASYLVSALKSCLQLAEIPGRMERELPPEPLLLGINLCFAACFPAGAAVAPGIIPVLTNPLAGPSPIPPAGSTASQQKVLPRVAP